MLRYASNGLLSGASFYCMCQAPPKECPFSFTASAIGFSYGIFGIVSTFLGRNDDRTDHDGCNKVTNVAMSLVEIAPLPLVNIELYRYFEGDPYIIALAHGIFIVPLICDCACSLLKCRHECYSTATLRDLTTLGNCVTLSFLAVIAGNWLYGRMALVALFIKCGNVMMDRYTDNAGSLILVLGNTMFFYLTGGAIQQLQK